MPASLLSRGWLGNLGALTLGVGTLLAASNAAAQAAVEVVPPRSWPSVGQVIPEVAVTTEEGQSLALRAAVATQPTVLIFYRGGWCPYCVRHLAAVGEVEAELKAAGYQILAISPDRPAKLAATPGRESLGYRLLSDSQAVAMQAFGLAFTMEPELVVKYREDYGIDVEADSGETHHMLPHPAVFLVGTDGVVQFAHVNPDYRQRLAPADLLAAAQAAVE